jgi:hypothetical protein
MAELFNDQKRDYQNRECSPFGATPINAHLIPYFGEMGADQVDSATIQRYVDMRKAQGRANDTIRNELATLRRTFHLAQDGNPPKVSFVPSLPKLKPCQPRQGFFEDTQYEAMLVALPDELKPVLTYAFFTGSRSAEILHLRWDQIDLRKASSGCVMARQNPAKAAQSPWGKICWKRSGINAPLRTNTTPKQRGFSSAMRRVNALRTFGERGQGL